MNQQLKAVLLSLTTNTFDLTAVKKALVKLDCPLESWEKAFVNRIINANAITEVFTAFFRLAPDNCFAKDITNDLIKH